MLWAMIVGVTVQLSFKSMRSAARAPKVSTSLKFFFASRELSVVQSSTGTSPESAQAGQVRW